MDTVYSSMRQHGLVRPLEGRVLGGVVAGLARTVAVPRRSASRRLSGLRARQTSWRHDVRLPPPSPASPTSCASTAPRSGPSGWPRRLASNPAI